MKTKIEKCQRRVNDTFAECLDAAFKQRFDVELETRFNIAAMRLISERMDGDTLTNEQNSFIAGYSAGYEAAMVQIVEF